MSMVLSVLEKNGGENKKQSDLRIIILATEQNENRSLEYKAISKGYYSGKRKKRVYEVI